MRKVLVISMIYQCEQKRSHCTHPCSMLSSVLLCAHHLCHPITRLTRHEARPLCFLYLAFASFAQRDTHDTRGPRQKSSLWKSSFLFFIPLHQQLFDYVK